MAEWQPIETAPKDDDDILISSGGGVNIGYYLNGDWWIEGGQIIMDTPTHWMPLPEPPHEET